MDEPGVFSDHDPNNKTFKQPARTPKDYYCTICDMHHQRTSKRLQEIHDRIIAGREVGSYLCGICSERFKKPYDLILHMRRHARQEMQRQARLERKRIFMSEQQMQLSDKSRITQKGYSCSFCYRPVTPRRLTPHMREHFGMISRQMPDTVKCSSSREPVNMKCGGRQVEKDNGNDRTVSAKNEQQAGIPYNTKNILHQGQWSENEREKQLENRNHKTAASNQGSPSKPRKSHYCNVCDKRHSTILALKKHAAVHYGRFPFVCDICFKTFKESSSLKIHMHDHNMSQPFICSMCGDSFRSKHTRYRHMVGHFGVKEYVCGHCNKRFGDSDTLLKHIFIHPSQFRLGTVGTRKQVMAATYSGSDRIRVKGTWSADGKAFVLDKDNI